MSRLTHILYYIKIRRLLPNNGKMVRNRTVQDSKEQPCWLMDYATQKQGQCRKVKERSSNLIT